MAFPRRYARRTESNNKYLNKKVEVDGIMFDSKKEAKRYQELKILEKTGDIVDLKLQVKYILIPAQYETVERYGKKGQRLKDGQKLIERECAYIADFQYYDRMSGELVVEDTKGYKDPSSAGYAKFIIKRKLMLYMHGIKIREV